MNSMLANGFAFLVARLLIPIGSFAINIAIARLWGKETLGAYVQLLSFTIIFQVAAGAGVSGLLTRELSARRNEIQPLLRLGRTLALLIGLGMTAAYAAFAWLLLPRDRWLAAAALMTTILPSAWIAVHEAYFLATRRHHRITLVALLENSLKIGLAIAAFVGGYGLAAICAAIAIGRIGAIALGAYLIRRDGCTHAWRPSWRRLGDLARPLVPFAALATASIAFFRSDILVVGQLLDPGSTGDYAAALAFYGVMLMLPEAAIAALYPRLACAYREAPGGFLRATEFGSRLLPLGMAPCALVLSAFSGIVMSSVYGPALADATPLLRVLTVALPIHAYNAILGSALQAAHLQRLALRLVSGALALQLLLLFVFIGSFGVTGAPVATIVSSLVLSVSMTLVLRSQVGAAAIGASGLLGLGWALLPLIACAALPSADLWICFGAGLFAIAGGQWVLGLLSPRRYRIALGAMGGPSEASTA
jgi:O-antigen/teichoic acid export membrane protein